MKKLLVRLLLVVIVLVILAVLAVSLLLDKAIKGGVETLGPKLTKVDIKLDSVGLRLLSGTGKVKGLVVGNPSGYKTPSAISVGEASLSLEPSSLLADKVVIRSVNVQAPEITFETDFKGNNLSKILSNVQEATGGSQTAPADQRTPAPADTKAGKKLQVDEFVIKGGKINVSVTALGGQSLTVPLPDIRLSHLGEGPEGITAAELTRRVLTEIEKEAVKASSGAVADLSKNAAALTRNVGALGTNTVDQAAKSLGDLFKKK